ncbi:envelope stress response membrane protein PspC [Fodinicurvata sp. EGI_FJ10296]|uniref:envelope stress response membrane protein PspC n=1 Tax=Fodinicurvata sp. EGI_FJ10296 TaxID=3231908 RepID=UPI00345400DE
MTRNNDTDGPWTGGSGGSPNPVKLRRNTQKGVMFGVCAGFADYFGLAVWQARALAVLMLIIFPPQAVIVYLILAFVLKPAPIGQGQPAGEERAFWQSVNNDPSSTFSSLRHRFRELDRRIAAMERHVTSEDYRLRRQFKDLE